MSNNKQNSIEFLEMQFEKYLNWKRNPVFDENCFDEIELMKSFKQAKAMHKEEIETSMSVAFLDGLRIGDENYKSPHEEWDEYYNETFGGNK